MNSQRIIPCKNGDVQRKDKGRKKPQALRSARKRAKMLKLKLLLESQSHGKKEILSKQLETD